MIVGIQLLGIAFGLFMVYMTYLYYRRGNYNIKDLMVWMSIWACFLFATIFPEILDVLVKPLTVYRLLDLLMIVSFMVLFMLIFIVYNTNKRNEKRIERIVREMALRGRENE